MKRTLINMNVAAAILAMSAATTATAAEFMDGKINVAAASDEQVAAWKEALAPVIDASLGEIDEAGVDSAAALEMFMSEIEAGAAE